MAMTEIVLSENAGPLLFHPMRSTTFR